LLNQNKLISNFVINKLQFEEVIYYILNISLIIMI